MTIRSVALFLPLHSFIGSSPVSQLIGASTDMMHDYERHANPVLSWRLPVGIKLSQSCQWDLPEGAGLTRDQSMEKIAKRDKKNRIQT
jgi:hypothetical protein